MRRAGIVLCGGKSSRMGRPKAWLPFGSEIMLQRVVRLLSESVDRVVVVAAAGQSLPDLPNDVRTVIDAHPDQGPLEGIACGLEVLAGLCDAAYVTGCDVPLLQPAFVSRMFVELGDADIAVAKEGRFHHPLAAVYRPAVAEVARRLLDDDRRRPLFLFESCRTREVPVETLRDADPQLQTLRNLNRPEDYEAALKEIE